MYMTVPEFAHPKKATKSRFARTPTRQRDPRNPSPPERLSPPLPEEFQRKSRGPPPAGTYVFSPLVRGIRRFIRPSFPLEKHG